MKNKQTKANAYFMLARDCMENGEFLEAKKALNKGINLSKINDATHAKFIKLLKNKE